MKNYIFGILALSLIYSNSSFAQIPPTKMFGRCSNIFGPTYDSSSKAYQASGQCQNGDSVNCATDPLDGTPDYYCQSGGAKEQDPNPSVAADEACGCLNN